MKTTTNSTTARTRLAEPSPDAQSLALPVPGRPGFEVSYCTALARAEAERLVRDNRSDVAVLAAAKAVADATGWHVPALAATIGGAA